MDRAKESIKGFMSKSGQHDTTVHESVSPSVQRENVEQTQHERMMPAVDREIHQDHYHTTEQPVMHNETLPEQHHHRAMGVEHKSYEHDDHDQVKRSLADEQSRYRDERTTTKGDNTRSVEAAVEGERVHHHVHENIQPVVHKHTVEPHVLHTTVPIHEEHHNKAQHHAASSLEPVSMEQFKSQGGALQGRGERTDAFSGEPTHFGQNRGMTGHSGGVGMDSHSGTHQSGMDSSRMGQSTGTGYPSTTGATGTSGSGYPSTTGTSTHGTSGTDYSNTGSSTTGTSTGTKPSMMDKLNPKVDATGDGKAGFMK